ncbi:MAG: DNA-directed RNA polymerase subunit omega [Alkaliphilus sp.]|nr:DNA-directed RNA polymerase subunit omega [Alkaliphilus sp.]
MLYPSINELLEKVDSRYTLVVVTAKRARQIIDEGKLKTGSCSKKPVSIATQEIFEEKISYKKEEESE